MNTVAAAVQMPSVAGMLHMMGDYTYKGPDRKNGKFPLLSLLVYVQ
jgi:hypothetical protein